MSIEKKGPEFDRGDLCRAIAAAGGPPVAVCESVLHHFAELLPDILVEHGRIELHGIGSITLGMRFHEVAPGKFEPIPGSKKIRLHPAADLQRAIE